MLPHKQRGTWEAASWVGDPPESYDEMNALVASEIAETGVGTGTKDDPIAFY